MPSIEAQISDHETHRRKYENEDEDAVEYFLSLVEKDPQSETGYFYLKLLATDRGDIPNALKYAKMLEWMTPNAINLWLNTGRIYEVAGTYDKAIECYRKELTFHRDNPYPHLSLGKIYYKQRKLTKAIRSLDRFVAAHEILMDFHVKEAREYLARIYYQTHQVTKEIQVYLDMLADDENDIYALRNLEAAYIDIKNYAASLEFLKKAKSLDFIDTSIDRNIIRAEKGLLRPI